jgi:hypothetical protein
MKGGGGSIADTKLGPKPYITNRIALSNGSNYGDSNSQLVLIWAAGLKTFTQFVLDGYVAGLLWIKFHHQ